MMEGLVFIAIKFRKILAAVVPLETQVVIRLPLCFFIFTYTIRILKNKVITAML